jgi:ligand-binding sensor domain-containing protein
MKQIFALWLLSVSAVLSFSARSAPADAPIGEPFVSRYSPAELNVYPQNFDLVQSPDGLIYVANSEGVLEFDGAHWRHVKLPEEEFARSLAVDDRGRVFVGSFNHFGYLERDAANQNRFVDLTLQFVDPENAVKLADVWNIEVTDVGVFFATRNAIFLWRDGGPAGTWTSEAGFGRMNFVHDRLLVRERGRGLLELKRGELALVSGTERFAETAISDLVPLTDGRVLIVAEDQLHTLAHDRLEPFVAAYQELPRSALIYRAKVLGDGSIAMGTTTGKLHVISPDGADGRSFGLSDFLISALMIASDGSLWVSTDEDIVRLSMPSAWSYFGSRHGFNGFITDFMVFRDERLISTNAGVYRFKKANGGVDQPLFERLDWGDNEFWDLAESGGDLLFADSYRVYRFSGEEPEAITPDIYPRRIRTSRFDENVVFVAGETGFTTLVKSQGEWQVAGEFNDMKVRAYYIVEEAEGLIWIGTYGSSAFRIRLSADYSSIEESKQFDETHGLKLDVTGGVVVSRVLDSVVFSTDEGLFQFNGEVFVPASHDVFENYGDLPVGVEFTTTETGEVWANTGREVFRGRLVGDRWNWTKLNLGPYDNTAVEAVVVEKSGVAWIGAAAALLRFDTDHPEPIVKQATILLRGMDLRQADQSIEAIEIRDDTSPEIAWGRHTLIFHYSLPNYADASLIEYQTLLEGFETEWTGWNREAERAYTSIEPGLYLFSVRERLPCSPP